MPCTPINIIIGRNIRHRRLLGGLTQKALADQLGISFQQVQKYERGSNAVTCERLLRIAAVLHCTAEDLYREALDAMGADAPEQPWNPYRMHTLVSHFTRIHSHGVRNHVCSIVRLIADASASGQEETL